MTCFFRDFHSSTVFFFWSSEKELKGDDLGLPNLPDTARFWRIYAHHKWGENLLKSPWPHQSMTPLETRFVDKAKLGSLQMLPASTSLCGRKHSQDPVGLIACMFYSSTKCIQTKLISWVRNPSPGMLTPKILLQWICSCQWMVFHASLPSSSPGDISTPEHSTGSFHRL